MQADMVGTLNKIAKHYTRCEFPSKALVNEFTRQLAVSLFPVIEGGDCHRIPERKLRKSMRAILEPLTDKLPMKPSVLVDKFFERLPEVKGMLVADVNFIAENDPAASGPEEVVLAYPGFYAILVFRLAHEARKLGVPIIPRVMTEHAHSVTGIDINPGATIGREFCIDHGTGIVIGETSVIGNRVKLYQGVTLGALSVSKDEANTKRHPTIEDDVVIYAGSTILGGETVVGSNSIIGGNVWLTKSVPPLSVVYHESRITVRERGKGKVSNEWFFCI